jgi:hypothetical protein
VAEVLNFHFYDTRGESVTLSRAKFYVIEYKGPRKKEPDYLVGEFLKVRDTAFNKELVLLDAMLAKNLGDLDKPFEDPASYKVYKDKKEVLHQVAATFIEEIGEEDSDLADEIEKAYIDSLIEEDLKDQFYLEEFKGRFEFDDKIIQSKTLGVQAYVENFYFNFVKPFSIQEPDFDRVIEMCRAAFMDGLANLIDNDVTRGADYFILRINYRFKIGNTDHYDVIPIPRLRLDDVKDGRGIAEKLIERMSAEDIKSNFKKYLEKDTRGDALSIVGYTLENLYSGEGL